MVLEVTIILLGGIVVLFGTKAYRKTKSRAMLLLVLGFIFLAIGAATAGLLFELLHYDLLTVVTIQAAIQVIGLFLIVYSILKVND